MKIKNTSTKVISIGTVALLPDDESIIRDEAASTPAIKMLIKKGFLTPLTLAADEPEKVEEKETEVKETVDTGNESENTEASTAAKPPVTKPATKPTTKKVGEKDTTAKK